MTQTTHIFTAIKAVEDMTDNQYRLALDDFQSTELKMSNGEGESNMEPLTDFLWDSTVQTIKRALLISERLEQEPSDRMWSKAMKLRNLENGFDPDYNKTFKAMVAELIKEIGE